MIDHKLNQLVRYCQLGLPIFPMGYLGALSFSLPQEGLKPRFPYVRRGYFDVGLFKEWG